MEENSQKRLGLKIMLAMLAIGLVFYIAMFLAWNLTNSPENRPTSFWWDDKKQGYVENPLEDRKK